MDYGKRMLRSNPTDLFNISGVDRYDVVYDIANGRVFIYAFTPKDVAAADIRVWVDEGSSTDLVRNPCTGASLTVQYRAKSPTVSLVSGLANAGLGVSVALCGASSLASAMLQPFSPGASAAEAAKICRSMTFAASSISPCEHVSWLLLPSVSCSIAP